MPPPELPAWLAAELPFERCRVSVPGPAGLLGLHLMEAGEGRPVLMVHGNPTWGFLYRKVTRALEGSGLRAVMPDLPGLGYSDRIPTAEHRLDSHGAWLGALIDGLDLRGIILVVQDWGGAIGMSALASRPERLAGLVVLNTVLGPPREGFKPTFFHRFARWPLISAAAFRVFGFPQTALHKVQGDPSSIRGLVARAYREPLRGLKNNAAPLALARMVPDSLSHPSIPELQRCQDFVTEGFAGPCAIVWGERDPILGRLRRRTERMLPRAEVTITEAGHFLQEEVPEQIAAAIKSVAAQLA